MFDINTIINNAIAQAVEAHITSLKQAYANQMGEMAARINDLEEANAILADLCSKQKLRIDETEARLSLNHDKLVERVSEVRIRTDEARALSLALAERQPQADPHAVLTREGVADVVRELWAQEYEQEVQDKVERAIEDHDFEDTVRQAVRNYDFSDAVESVIDDYDMSDKITEALDDKVTEAVDGIDFESKVRDVLRNARIDISI